MLLAIISLILLILISGFFSIAETSLMATNRYRLKHAAKSGNAHAKQILHQVINIKKYNIDLFYVIRLKRSWEKTRFSI